MKIFVHTLKISNRQSYVGTILVGDHNQQYARSTMIVNSVGKNAELAGISRAIAFKRNMMPLYCNEQPQIYCEDLTLKDFKNNEYLKDLNPILKSPTDDLEKQFQREVESMTVVECRQYALTNNGRY